MKVVEAILRPQRPYFRCILLNFSNLNQNRNIHLCANVNNVNDMTLTTDV